MTAAPQIQAIALDFDGVLTDGTIWWGFEGQEWKRLSFRDIMGVSLGSRAGLTFAIISGEDSPLVDRYAAKMGIRHVFKGIKDKSTAFRTFAAAIGVEPAQIAYMGDDVNDLAAMQLAGLSAAPLDAHPEVLAVAGFRSKFPGGAGAVREFIDFLLKDK
jgi:3-deoxy-D-manno-octulosonate 8-phosphate phosphatase (KDO 8-P phosphatase)